MLSPATALTGSLSQRTYCGNDFGVLRCPMADLVLLRQISTVKYTRVRARLQPSHLFRNGCWLDAKFLSMITSHPVQVVTISSLLQLGLVGILTPFPKRHSLPARRRRNYRRCKVRQGKSSLLHEQACASPVSGQGFFQKRVAGFYCQLPSEKDLINVDMLFLRVVQSWRQRRSRKRSILSANLRTTSDCPKRVMNMLPSCRNSRLVSKRRER